MPLPCHTEFTAALTPVNPKPKFHPCRWTWILTVMGAIVSSEVALGTYSLLSPTPQLLTWFILRRPTQICRQRQRLQTWKAR